MSHAPEKGPSQLIKGAIAGVVLLGVLVWSFNRGPGEEPLLPSLPVAAVPLRFQWSDLENAPHTLTNGVDRLAVMESFSALDSKVANECVPPLKLNQEWFPSEAHFQIASRFLADMRTYQSPDRLQEFMAAVEDFLATPEASQSGDRLQKLKTFPGSNPLLESQHDPDLLSATRQIAGRRLQQLNMRAQTGFIKPLMAQGLGGQLRAAGVEVTSPSDAPTELQAILRYWELTSTRYLLCQSGNAQAGKIVEALYPGTFRPVYSNAPNAVLDPVRRRFQVLFTFEAEAIPPGAGLLLKESPDGPIALVAFKGALPRAKLYADWRQIEDESFARKIIFSPSFFPQLQVILRQENLPNPQQPAGTGKLPRVKIQKLNARQTNLEIPPLKHNTVLMLTHPHDARWRVTLNGRAAKVLRANLNACAVYLEPSTEARTLVFIKP